jgi:hypothetical protein
MSVTLTVSDKTFQRLKATAKTEGKENVEQLLDEWSKRSDSVPDAELKERRMVAQKIKAFQQRMAEKYGTMADSTLFIREDRNR